MMLEHICVFDKDILYAPNLLSIVPKNVVSGRTWGVWVGGGLVVDSEALLGRTAPRPLLL